MDDGPLIGLAVTIGSALHTVGIYLSAPVESVIELETASWYTASIVSGSAISDIRNRERGVGMFLVGQFVSGYILWRLFLASLLWVGLSLLIRFHPRGIEQAGVVLIALGFLWWLSDPLQPIPFGLTLFLLGFLIHAIGRLLYRLRTLK